MRRFSEGDTDMVRALGKAGHVRIAHYIRHQTGTVVGYRHTSLQWRGSPVREEGPAADVGCNCTAGDRDSKRIAFGEFTPQ